MRRLFVILVALGSELAGQNGPPIVGYGFTLPTPMHAASGQLLTVMAEVPTSPRLVTVRAPADADLPTALAGVTARLFLGGTWAVPILEVHPFYTCQPDLTAPGACSQLIAVTVQIPLEAPSCRQGCDQLGSIPTGSLNFYQGGSQPGSAGFLMDVVPFVDQVHVLTNCDVILTDANTAALNETGLPCSSVVTHIDGSLVSAQAPAKTGEVLVAYAIGLGQTNPPLTTGKLVTAAAPTQTTFTMDFNYRPNALATKPLPGAPQPLYAGATPGFVGLYQVNFTVPPPPLATLPCAAQPVPGQNVVYSNLTVSVGGQTSFDGARICVAVPNS